MGTKSVRLNEEIYKRIAAHKRDDETFSEAISRLTSNYSLVAFAGGTSAAEANATAREDRRERLQGLADTD